MWAGRMRLSARNQLAGTVASIEVGAVTAVVKIELSGGQRITSSVTKDAVEGGVALVRSRARFAARKDSGHPPPVAS